MEIKLKDERLEKRWLFLVRSQMKVSSPLGALISKIQLPVALVSSA
jgi:hypothetical protein